MVENSKVQKNDIFTILAAILNLQVEILLKFQDSVVTHTGNPLLFLNEES